MGLEKYRHKKEYDEDGKEIRPELDYVNVSVVTSQLRRAVHGEPNYSTITNRRISILDEG